MKISKREEKTIRKVEHEELRRVAEEFLRIVKKKVDLLVLLHDIESLDRLVSQVDIVGAFEIVKVIREKGFSKELDELCDKVGRGQH